MSQVIGLSDRAKLAEVPLLSEAVLDFTGVALAPTWDIQVEKSRCRLQISPLNIRHAPATNLQVGTQ